MQIQTNVSLKPYHTFSIEQSSRYLVEANNVDDLIAIYRSTELAELPKMVLGRGSNVLFVDAFEGVVILNKLLGKALTEHDDHYLLHVNGGEDWPELVKWSIEQGMGGLENLALIPGCAGSAPIQNIGAYGVELQDVCEYVDILCLDSLSTQRLSRAQCEFGYRDSIFKHALYQKAIVTAIGLKLPKHWQPQVSYGPLQALPDGLKTPEGIFNEVCHIRQSKLPDPKVIGNAGSFFKNPVITQDHFDQLKGQFPTIVGYPNEDGVKVAAGWLIDQCDLKGFQVGGAQVHPKQALVLTNTGSASSSNIVDLAQHVKQAVFQRYQIELEHEVRFIGAIGETKLHHLRG